MKGPLLVILPHNPGDVVMGLAAVRRVKAALPDLTVDYVVGEECRDLAEGHPLLRRVHVIPRKALLTPWQAGDADAALRALEDFAAALSEQSYAASVNLFQEKFGGVLHGLVRSNRKVGLQLAEGSHYRVGSRILEHLFAIPAARRENGWHAVDIYVRALREALGGEAGGAPPAPDIPWLPPLQAPPGWNLAPRSYLAFHPGSAWRGKQWPEAHWAALTAACVRSGRQVVFTGAPEERHGTDRILALLPPGMAATRAVHDWVGKTSLAGAAWIHGRAAFTVSGDTVAMHLAAAGGTPTLSLFGPSNPVETGPYGKGHFIFQTQLDLPADLEFDRPHPGLAALRPEVVARLLLEGAAPSESEAFRLWETGWDAKGDMQSLRDHQGRPHPDQVSSAALRARLDAPAEAYGFPATTAPALRGGREAVRRALERCGPSATAPRLSALAEADRELGEETRDSVIWEAYRVSLNGLSLADWPEHFRRRKALFARALAEEAGADAGEAGADAGEAGSATGPAWVR